MGATNCPETPRQKMIGMMYLVYTALLALNVSAEILTGFVTVGNAMDESNKNIAIKLTDSYNKFHDAYDTPRHTDEEWQKMLETKPRLGVPKWMESIIAPVEVPKDDDLIYYSTGC